VQSEHSAFVLTSVQVRGDRRLRGPFSAGSANRNSLQLPHCHAIGRLTWYRHSSKIPNPVSGRAVVITGWLGRQGFRDRGFHHRIQPFVFRLHGVGALAQQKLS
jgi:hypothetical protein